MDDTYVYSDNYWKSWYYKIKEFEYKYNQSLNNKNV